MIVQDIRPVDVEITTIFTLTELQHLKTVLDGAIIRKDMYDEEVYGSYEEFKSVIEALLKETEDGVTGN
jgi:uncharacterized protein (UPF0179 family)